MRSGQKEAVQRSQSGVGPGKSRVEAAGMVQLRRSLAGKSYAQQQKMVTPSIPVPAPGPGPQQAKAAPEKNAAPGAGRPLPDGVRGQMEQSFGEDFSSVRVHEGAHVQSLGAQAYAQGEDVHFAPGNFQPDSSSGQELIGHELTHVVQQRRGRVAVPAGKGLPINSDPALEAEADQMGTRAASGQPAKVSGGASSPGAQAKVLPIQGRFHIVLRPEDGSSDDNPLRYLPWTDEEFSRAPYDKGELVDDEDVVALGRSQDEWALFTAEFNRATRGQTYEIVNFGEGIDIEYMRAAGEIDRWGSYPWDDPDLEEYLPHLSDRFATELRSQGEVARRKDEVDERTDTAGGRVRPRRRDRDVEVDWDGDPIGLVSTLEEMERRASKARLRANVYRELKHEAIRDIYSLYTTHLEYAYLHSGAISDKTSLVQRLNKTSKKAGQLVNKRLAQLQRWRPSGPDVDQLEGARNAEIKWALCLREILAEVKPISDEASDDREGNEASFLAAGKRAKKQIKADKRYQERRGQFEEHLALATRRREFADKLVLESETRLADLLWRDIYGNDEDEEHLETETHSSRVDVRSKEMNRSRMAGHERSAERTFEGLTAHERRINELIDEYGTGNYFEKFFQAQDVTAKILAQFAHEATGSRLINTIPSAAWGALIRKPAYQEVFRKTRVGGSDIKLTLGFMLGDDNVGGIGLEATFSGSVNIQDDRRFRVSGGFQLNAKAQIGPKDIAQLKATLTLFKGSYTKVYVDETHWAANLAEQIAKAIVMIRGFRHHSEDPTQMTAEELEERAQELGVYSKSQKEMLAYKGAAVTEVTTADFLAGASVSLDIADEFASIGGSIERTYWKFTKDVVGNDGEKRKMKTHGHQVVREGSLKIGPVSCGVKYSKIYGHANPDNDGKYLNLSLGLPSISLGRSGSTDGDTGELSQTLDVNVFGANLEQSAGDLDTGNVQEWVEGALPWDDFGGSFSEAFEHSMNLEANFVEQDTGRWALQYLRATPTTKYSVERGGGAGIASGSIGFEASTSAGIFEYLGSSTVTYWQTVYDGLSLRPKGDDQWQGYTRQHEDELRNYLNQVGKRGSAARKEVKSFDGSAPFIGACTEDVDGRRPRNLSRRIQEFNTMLAANKPKAAWTPSTRESNRNDAWVKLKCAVRSRGLRVQNPIGLDDASKVSLWMEIDNGSAELDDYTTSIENYLDREFSVVMKFTNLSLKPLAMFPSTWQADAMGWFKEQFGIDVLNNSAYQKLAIFAQFSPAFAQFMEPVIEAYGSRPGEMAEWLEGGVMGMDSGTVPQRDLKAAKRKYADGHEAAFAQGFSDFAAKNLRLKLPRPTQ